jgi:hypothetical protein
MFAAVALAAVLAPQEGPKPLDGPFLRFRDEVVQVLPHGTLGRRALDPDPERERGLLAARPPGPPETWDVCAGIARELRFVLPGGAEVTARMDDAAALQAQAALQRFAETVRLYSGGWMLPSCRVQFLGVLRREQGPEPFFLVPARDDDFGLAGRPGGSVFLFWSPGRLPISMLGGTLPAPLGPGGAAASGLAHVPLRTPTAEAWSEVLLHEWLHQFEAMLRERGLPWLPGVHDARDLGYDDEARFCRDFLRDCTSWRACFTRDLPAAAVRQQERVPHGPLPALAGDDPAAMPSCDDLWLANRTGRRDLRLVAGNGWVLASHAGAPRAKPAPGGETVLDNQLSLDREAVLVLPFADAAGRPRQLVLVRPDLRRLFEAWLGPLGAVAHELHGIALPRRRPQARGNLEWGGTATPLYVFETGFAHPPHNELELLAPRDGDASFSVRSAGPPVAGQPWTVVVETRGVGGDVVLRAGDRAIAGARDGDLTRFTLTPQRPGPLALTLTAGRFGELPLAYDVAPRVELSFAPESGPLAVVRPGAPFLLKATNHGPALECALEAWTPPDVRIAGVPSALRLAENASATFACAVDVEAERPAGDVAVRLVARARGEPIDGRTLGRADVILRCAVGRDFLRHDFEPARRRVPGGARGAPPLEAAAEWTCEVVTGDAAVGHGHLRCADQGGTRHGRVHLHGADAPSFDTEQFPHLAFWFRARAGGRAALNVHLGDRSAAIPLVGEFARWGDARVALPRPELRLDGSWQRVVYDLDAALDAAFGDGTHRVTALDLGDPRAQWSNRFTGDDAAIYELDDFAVQRSGEHTPGDRLRDLTQRFAAGAGGAALDGLARELAAIERAVLGAQDRVDHVLLGHRIALRRLEPTLPKKEPQQPCGVERYAALLRHEHLLAQTPDELIVLGREQMRAHQQLLAELAPQVAPGRTWREVVALLQQRHPSAEQLPAFARAAFARARDFAIAEGLLTIPFASRHGVIDVVTDGPLSRTYPFGGYGGARPSPFGFTGTYFVSPPAKWMSADEAALRLRGNHEAWTRVVALHELVPGHHLQNVVHQLRPLSPFRRACSTNVFVEGWALYCEDLMHQHGFFPDVATRFTQLQMRLWRAARVVIDASFQCGRLGRAECERLLVDEVALDPVNASAEVLRYVDAPSQPMSYLVGWLQIRELIDEARRRGGAEFRLPAFLDRLLSFGPVPFAAIRAGLWR